jgi:hypothetical protein
LVVLLSMLLILGCGDSATNPDETPGALNAVKTLGMQEDFECLYLQYDSIFTYPPFRVVVDTTTLVFSAAAIDENRDRIDLWFDSVRTAAIRITSNSVVNLGYYRRIADRDSIQYFSEPAVIFPNNVQTGTIWEEYAPPISEPGQMIITSQLFISWGFDVTRTYLRREDVLTPMGLFNCHVVQSDYRLHDQEDIFKTEFEYYADSYGLVKLYSSGRFGSSLVVMVSRGDFNDIELF